MAAAQARIVALQNDVRKAEREPGHAAFALVGRGELSHPDLEAAAVALAEVHEALAEKEHEIAKLRGESEAPSCGGRSAERPRPVGRVRADIHPQGDVVRPDRLVA